MLHLYGDVLIRLLLSLLSKEVKDYVTRAMSNKPAFITVLRNDMQKNSQNLLLLHVEVVDNDADEKIECEERSKDDEEDEVQVHVDTYLVFRLNSRLQVTHTHTHTHTHTNTQ